MMLLVVAGGGTGGHLFPGLAVADALARSGEAPVRFIGSAFGIEARVIPDTPYPFMPLMIRGLRGGGLRSAMAFVAQMPRAVWAVWRSFNEPRPSLVLGLGGYGSAPVIVAAWLRGIPSVLLEQNAKPGMANRTLAWLAARVCTTFEDSARFFPRGKAIHTGNPVRPLATSQKPDPGHFTIFAFGGSQGARSINHAMVGAAALLNTEFPGLRIIHQTGVADVDWVREAYRAAGVEAEVNAFIHDMGSAYGRANLIVCRAGATTLAELANLSKAAILVPYPFAADDHQRANAEVMVRQGAAEMILDRELSETTLATHIRSLAMDRERIAAMSAAAGKQAIPAAADRVLAVCRQVVGESQ